MIQVYPTVHLLARPDVAPSTLSVVRAGAATRITALGRVESVAAHTLRHDFDPASGAYRGWLIEEARTNQILYAEDLTQAPWLTGGASIAVGTQTAPDGEAQAAMLTEDTSADAHGLYQNDLSFVSGTPYTLSVFARSGGRERLQLVLPSTAFGEVQSAVFDLTGGSTGTTEGDTVPTIEALADDWYRCAITATATVTTTAPVHLRLRDTTSVSGYTGDGESGVHLWGVQLEAGSLPSSYIATEAAAVTRAADILSVALDDGLLNPFEGSVLVRGTVPDGGTAVLAEMSDGGADNRLTVTFDGDGGTVDATVVEDGTAVVILTGSGVTGDAESRAAVAFAADDAALTVDGGTITSDTAGAVPGVTTLTLGSTGAGVVGPRCWVRQVGLFPRRLGDADLQTLTA